MARHLGQGTTLWGQPYGSPLDAWVAAPFVAALGPRSRPCAGRSSCSASHSFPSPTPSAARAPAGGPARRAPPGLPASLSSCCSRPCPRRSMRRPWCSAAFSCSSPLRLGPGLEAGEKPEPASSWGALAGLALWTHLMSASRPLAASSGWPGARGRRRGAGGPRPRASAAGERALLDARARRPPGHAGRQRDAVATSALRGTWPRSCPACTSRWAASSGPTCPWWPTIGGRSWDRRGRRRSCSSRLESLLVVLAARRACARARRPAPARRRGPGLAGLPLPVALRPAQHPLPHPLGAARAVASPRCLSRDRPRRTAVVVLALAACT